MKIVNNADRTIHFEVQAPGSKTLWEGDLSTKSSTEKQLSGSGLSCSTQFHTDPPQLPGELKQGLTGDSTVTIEQVFCGIRY